MTKSRSCLVLEGIDNACTCQYDVCASYRVVNKKTSQVEVGTKRKKVILGHHFLSIQSCSNTHKNEFDAFAGGCLPFLFVHSLFPRKVAILAAKEKERTSFFILKNVFFFDVTYKMWQRIDVRANPHRSAFFVHFRQPRNRIKRGANVFLKSYCRVRRVECRRTWPPSFFCRNAQLVAIL